MNSNSSSASKRLRTKTSFDDKTSITVDGISSSAGAESNVATTEIAPNAFVNVFTDDILPVIFDNLEILSVEDLLNFRLVNRCWRDGATSVLLKRNIGKISVKFGEVTIHENNGNVVTQFIKWITRNLTIFEENPHCSYNYFNGYQPRSFLSDLSALISTSPKFPCNSVYFHSKCTSGFDNLCLKPNFNHHQDPNDKHLRHFFSLYGKKIRKLSLSGKISKEAFQNLLHVQMPHLICLDLQDFTGFQDQSQKTSQMQMSCLPRLPNLQINEVVLGTRFEVTENEMDFLKDLISVSPNLSSIRNADENSLLFLLEMGKCQLIKDLEFCPALCDIEQTSKMTNLILEPNLLSLKLSKLTIDLQGINGHSYDVAIMFLKAVINSSKDSLKYLELILKPSFLRVDNFILPLTNLKSLKLVDLESSVIHDMLSLGFLGDILERVQISKSITPAPENYFPRLREVNFQMGDQTDSSDKLIDLFWLKNLRWDGFTTILGNTLPTVTNVEVSKFLPCYRNMPKLFPNATQLKIQGLSWSSLPNWIWTAFPKLEGFEVSFQYLGMETNRVDSFFTGISPELCATLESAGASSGIKSRLLRSQPCIGDCKNLKEIKLNFPRSLCSKFASKVTATHGFQDVIHRTKVILSFDSIQMSVLEMEKTCQLLEPVAAFVEIRMKK